MRVLGIDPGTRCVGYGVVETQGNRLIACGFGAIRPSRAGGYAARLQRIFEELGQVARESRPDVAALEEAFYGKSVSAALRMGEGRGVAIVAVALAGTPLVQYSPAEVKKAVVGNGRAHKSQVQEMVRMLLGLRKAPQPEDAADALAVAICHCNRAAWAAPSPARERS
jgi:crossover junction endodeoxyribonuclease RuvC